MALAKYPGGLPAQIDALALALLPGLPLRKKVELVRRFESYRAALTCLASPIPRALIAQAEDEYRNATRQGFRLVDLMAADYPASLKTTVDPPLVLYLWGRLDEDDENSIALVGSRRASAYGRAVCHKLAAELARRGAPIVSGMARGIDAVAHRAALEVGGRTIAVLGSGLNRIYPPEHRRLAEEISEKGAVISELPLTSPPLPGHFPMRNRIIAGITLGTVVIEAAERSGSLITARHALEQNREVFAIPGPIDSKTTIGVHRLIQDGAKLVTCVADVIDELRPEIQERLAEEGPADGRSAVSPKELVEDEQIVFNRLRHSGTADTDRLVELAGISPARVMAALATLRIKGLVSGLPGGFYWIKDDCRTH
jgi:DNA processing protein